jgi:NADH-quinone oxidoreductase subunit I
MAVPWRWRPGSFSSGQEENKKPAAGFEDGFCEGGSWWYANRDMGMPSLLRKIFMVDLLQGLKVTFLYQDPKEIYTEQYPLQRPQVAERYRGAPRLNVNPDTNETMCIACDLCALACPENLIVVSSERNEKTRRKELTNFTYDLSRCMFCGLCEDACPTDALELTQDFELASYTRDGAIWNREMLEKGPQPTQYKR